MQNMTNALPASLRTSNNSRPPVTENLAGRGLRPVLVAGPAARAAALSKSRFSRMPQEPEDARMTGVTRSLNRRLLALNLYGTLSQKNTLTESRIA